MTDPIRTEYHSDDFLEPKEAITGMQAIQASKEKAKISQAELAQKRRHDEDSLAEDIIEESRVQLMLKFRFLDRALWRMALASQRTGMTYPMGTDGKKIYYDPQRIIARFRQSFDEQVRDYLHMVMHCIFRHPYDRSHKNKDAWSLTCDLIVESVTMDLCGDRFPSEDDQLRKSAIDEISLAAGGFLPNKLYEFLSALSQTPDGQHGNGIDPGRLNEWRILFERDDHAAWPANATDASNGQEIGDDVNEEMIEDDENPDFQNDGLKTETLGNDESGEEESRSQGGSENADSQDDAADVTPDEEADSEQENLESYSGGKSNADEESADQQEWEELAKEIEMNLETFSKEWGEDAGKLISNLALANRKTYDYTDFLRKFMVVTEQIRLNPEEFDYTYYTFGMQMYGNMPFIEPLEYKESETICDFVIAIDTSESVSGPLVSKFIEHTFSIMKESEDFSRDINVHLIQADSKVQSDLKITDIRQVDKIFKNGQFAIRGFGGTDFRPTFDYIEMLRAQGEFRDLKGMIYFTDGLGQFPEKMPDYEVAFVFLDDGATELPPVPPWAIKLTIDERDIERMH